MKKIIHLSDIHVGGNNKPKYGGKNLTSVFNMIIDNIIGSEIIQNDSSIIIITGDIAHRAKQGSYDIVKRRLNDLINEGFTVFIVPGNHDYKKGMTYKKKNIMKFTETFSAILFEDNIHTNRECDKQFPISRIIDEGTEHSVSLIGLDSMAGRFYKKKRRLNGRGSFGKRQLKCLDALLFNKRIINSSKRVICFHHRLLNEDHKPEFDWETLHELVVKHSKLGTHIDAILYGHKHNGTPDPNMWGIVHRCYDGSSSTGRRRTKTIKPIMQRIIDLSSNDPDADMNGNFHK